LELRPASMSSVLFSIVLPVYRQENQIAAIFSDYFSALSTLSDTWELIFVVNGSNDRSFDIAAGLAAGRPNVHVHRLEKAGWGMAVRYGISVARGTYVCYTNSARTQIPDLLLILKYAKINENVVIKASRIVRASFFRKLGSVIYNFENRLLFQTAVMDVNGTPKVFSKVVWESLQIHSNDDLIDAEAIAKCFKLHVPVVEVPVRLTGRRRGRSTTNLRSAFRMYFGLLRLRWKI
jgi:glycosyltransferase involved in cell wall biosynthesis